jgi:hypothetical protein
MTIEPILGYSTWEMFEMKQVTDYWRAHQFYWQNISMPRNLRTQIKCDECSAKEIHSLCKSIVARRRLGTLNKLPVMNINKQEIPIKLIKQNVAQITHSNFLCNSEWDDARASTRNARKVTIGLTDMHSEMRTQAHNHSVMKKTDLT